MAKVRGDVKTLDLLSWEPPEVAEQFTQERVRGHSDKVRMARAFSEAITESGKSRDDIHAEMVRHMGHEFSRNTLDRCTAPSADAHEFTTSKLIAFLQSVPDIRVINELLRGTGFAAVPEQYLGAIEEAICEDQIERLTERKRLARRSWKGNR